MTIKQTAQALGISEAKVIILLHEEKLTIDLQSVDFWIRKLEPQHLQHCSFEEMFELI